MRIQLQTVDLHVDLRGSGTALLLLHGALSTFRQTWQQQIVPFSQRWTLIGPDLRGHGRSFNRLDRLDLRQMADDLAQLLDFLQIDRCAVCGFSGGASTALFFALRHPARVTRLVLISNNYQRDEARAAADFWNPERLDSRRLSKLAQIHSHEPAQLLGWWQAEDRLRPDFTPAALAAVAAPTLVVGGDRDPIVPLAQTLGLFRHIRDSRLAILPAVGHGAPYRAAPQFNTIVLKFLSEPPVA